MKNHQTYIKKTYELARQSQNNGNHPFGALLVMDGEIISAAENTVVSSGDITQHAELNLVRQASQNWAHKDLQNATLYSSTEPCVMCSGAIFWSGISSVVYGCSAKKMAEITTGSFVVSCSHIFDFGNRTIKTIGPILEEDGATIHRGFWP